MSLRILWQDESLACCEKPAGILSEGELPALVREACGCPAAFLVHRLDRDVGGAMVTAKTQKAAAALSAQIQNGQFQKEYLAVVCGCPKEPDGTLRDLLFHDAKKNKTFVVRRERKGVREAVLSYRVLAHTADAPFGEASLVCIRLETGRTHQIRVQFASRQLPLAGDRRYGGRGICGIALWSRRISFLHPVTGESLEITAPPPDQFPWNLFPGAVPP